MLPVHLDLKEKSVLIIGGGKIAFRRLTTILPETKRITVVSPELSDQMEQLITMHQLVWKRKSVEREDLTSAFLIVAATNDPTVNEWVTKIAQPHQLVNCVSQAELGSVIMPKIIRKGRIVISVSTSGASPTHTKRLSTEIESLLQHENTDELERLYKQRKERS
ncbi:precorrin-2 dehydrogenase/sirohydrochlorin ferrochelatase family protein [Bacillus sp. NPDC077027]|uniref:precorrin-2 dehydrogenase/sirohydrochlorin ferrochelatase family protein n=1 Tax=Bacillus sp. NPDC077027 TaxID=3390548 RepID=UPI003D03D6E7